MSAPFEITPEHHDFMYADISAAEASAFSGFSTKALRDWRTAGIGPEYSISRRGAIRYRRVDLLGWMNDVLTEHFSKYGF